MNGGPAAGKPFQVPRSVYEAAVDAMVADLDPVLFDEWRGATNDRLGRAAPDYMCRAVLRFWRSTDPPLVKKVGTRYQPTEPARFSTQARRAFEALPEDE